MTDFELINKLNYVSEIVDKYIKILSIDEEIDLKKSYQSGETSIVYDCNRKKWNLIYSHDDHIFLLIHELGHLYLSNITKCIYFAKQPDSSTNREIFFLVNALVDAIVNYKISRFETVYPYFVNYIKYVLHRAKNGIKIQYLPSPISYYIDYYLEMNFYFKKQDFQPVKQKIQRFLKNYENQLKNYGILTDNRIELLQDALKQFTEYLESEKNITLIYCITKILKSLRIWSNGLVNNTIRQIFHLKKD